MIKILEFKTIMQSDIKEFVIKNMKNELNIKDNETFYKITKDLDNIQENYINNGGNFLVAYNTETKEIAGTIAMKFENKNAVLKRFYVLEKYRKMKIGLLLYKTLEEKIKLKNIQEIYLVSGKESEYAHKFYERNGWVVENKNPGIFIRDGAILYKKTKKTKLQKLKFFFIKKAIVLKNNK